MIKESSLFILIIFLMTSRITTLGSPNKKPKDEKPEEQTSSFMQQTMSNRGSNLGQSNTSKGYNLNSLSISFKTAPSRQQTIGQGTFGSNLSMLVNPSMFLASSKLTTEKLEDFCSTKASDFFNGLQNEDSLQKLFDNESLFQIKDIDQRLFDNTSLSSFYNGRKLFRAEYLPDTTVYTIKRFQKSHYKQALKEIVFYKTVVKKKVDDKSVFGHFGGCLHDDDNVYLMHEKGSIYESLSDSNVYNRVRNMSVVSKLEVLYKLTKSVSELQKVGVMHNMISPDSYMINLESLAVKLIHFENITQGPKSLKPMTSLLGTIIHRNTVGDFAKPIPKTTKTVNNDLYALVKVMIHLDSNFYESRFDSDGIQKLDMIDHASYDSIVQLYQNNNYPTPEKLLEFVHTKCDVKQAQGNIMDSIIHPIFSFLGGESEVVYDCEGLNKIYEDVLDINSKTAIEDADQLLKRLEQMISVNKALKSTLNLNFKNLSRTSIIFSRPMKLDI